MSLLSVSLLSLLSLLLSTGQAATSSQQAPAHYKFSYHVRDKLSGQDFGQEEERSGTNTGGEYRVSLPDGRQQIVTYTVADPLSGYIADVSYQGLNRQSYLIQMKDQICISSDYRGVGL